MIEWLGLVPFRVALLDPVVRNQHDTEIAVHIGADDRLVVARNGPAERLLRVGHRRRAAPNDSSILAVYAVFRLDFMHARRIAGGLRTWMVGVAVEDDRL